MSNPFVGEIRLVAFNFPPQGWAFCDGSLLSIAQNEVLFDLIGTTYGGDGITTFALPNLLGRAPVHVGSGFVLGQIGGTETATILPTQVPAHQHPWDTAASADTEKFSGGYLAKGTLLTYDPAPTAVTPLAASTIGEATGGTAHPNMAPFLAVSFVISMFGIFPSQG
jgi:microcystin-dependent protein